MVKPEMIPQASIDAFSKAHERPDCRLCDAIAAALSAWPGAQRMLATDLKGFVLRLPLPREAANG